MSGANHHRYPGPSLTDWLLVIGSALFVVGGLVLLRSNPDVALASIVFFGGVEPLPS